MSRAGQQLAERFSALLLKAKRENVTVDEPDEMTKETVDQYEKLLDGAIKVKVENEKRLARGEDVLCPICGLKGKREKDTRKSCINCNVPMITPSEYREAQKAKANAKG